MADVLSYIQQVSDLLACARPAALGVAARPQESTTWLAAMGVAAQRRGALEFVHLPMGDWRSLLARLADAEGRTTAVLCELSLRELVNSIDGLLAVGARSSRPRSGSCPVVRSDTG